MADDTTTTTTTTDTSTTTTSSTAQSTTPVTTTTATKRNSLRMKSTVTPVKISSTPVTTSTVKIKDPVTGFAQLVANIQSSGADSTKTLLSTLQAYVKVMSNDITSTDGARQQQLLWFAIFNTAEKITDRSEFRKNWSLILAFYYQYRDGVFSMTKVNRFSDSWSRKDSRLTAFQRLNNLLIVTAAPDTRFSAVSKVNMTSTLDLCWTEAGKANINAYYRI